MDLGKGLGHLTYSTLVHPGDTWADMWTSLTTYVPQVQKRVCPTAPFGVSLRLSNASASTLVKDQGKRDQLRSFIAGTRGSAFVNRANNRTWNRSFGSPVDGSSVSITSENRDERISPPCGYTCCPYRFPP